MAADLKDLMPAESAIEKSVDSFPSLMRGAAVAGILCLCICAVMLTVHLRGKVEDPLNSPRLVALKEQLLANPKDEQIKARIRALDLELRGRYFHQVFLNQSGAWLAIGAAGVFLMACHQALKHRSVPPMPRPNPQAAEESVRSNIRSRWVVVGSGAGLAIILLWVGTNVRTSLPPDLAAVEKLLGPGSAASASGPVDFASDDEMRKNWPSFRGFGGTGVCLETNLPLNWDAKTGTGILWKVTVPAAGFNSPIIWGERVFLSGADAQGRQVFCYSTANGELLWQKSVQNVPGSPARSPEVPEQTGHAASTMATDGRRVYAIFANGDLAAFTLDGKPVWSKNLGVPKNPHGHATSLLTWQGRLVVQLDQGEAEQNLSKIYAFDGASGRVLWQRNRAVPASWATPMVINAAGKNQILTLAVPWVIAYEAKDGVELWRAGELNNEITPSPAFGSGFVFAVSPNEKLMAIRPDGQGDVTSSRVAWTAEDNIPDISSPVSAADLVFAATTPGMFTCYDARDGKKQWEQELGMECNASPAAAGNRLYLAGGNGIVLVIEAARTYKEVARNDLQEPLFASPAFAQGRIFFRGNEHLFCVGDEAKFPPAK